MTQKIAIFTAGDRVKFVKEFNPAMAADDPFYEPPVPPGTTGAVVNVGNDHIRVKLDDERVWPEPIIVWDEDAFPEAAPQSVACIVKYEETEKAR